MNDNRDDYEDRKQYIEDAVETSDERLSIDKMNDKVAKLLSSIEKGNEAQAPNLQFMKESMAYLESNMKWPDWEIDSLNSSLRELRKVMVNFENAIKDILDESKIIFIENVSPIVETLRSICYPEFLDLKSQIGEQRLEQFNKFVILYWQELYDCNWFPYAGDTQDMVLFNEVIDIIKTSRGKSKRRKTRVDKAVFSYYTLDRIKMIQNSWKLTDLEPHIKRMIKEAINAHIRGEYVLTITCLSTLWEGIIHYKSGINGKRFSTQTKQELRDLADGIVNEKLYLRYFEELIMCDIKTNEDMIDGVPNRNGISHSKYSSYPTGKMSLNAILFTDFIVHLQSKHKVGK